MSNTYEVIPYHYLKNETTGETASMFGARPPGFTLVQNGFTVRTIDNRGGVTTGLHWLRVPATEEDATKAAISTASATNGVYAGIKSK